MTNYALLAAVVAALCVLQVSAIGSLKSTQLLVVGDLRLAQLGQSGFQAELDAFLKGNVNSGFNFSDTTFQAALTANIDTANIISNVLNLVAALLFTAAGAVGIASATIALDVAAALYADSLASYDLELEAFERTFETDLPANIAAVGRIVEMFSNARAAVAGKPQALTATLFGQSADGVGPEDATAVVGGVVGEKIKEALQAIEDAKNTLTHLLSTKAGKALSAAVSE